MHDLLSAFQWWGDAADLAPQVAQASPWMPIEKAPQDGYFLVHEDTAIRAMFRHKGEWQHVAYPAIIDTWGYAIVGQSAKNLLPVGYRLELRDGCCQEPTHWMPLPEAPRATDTSQEEA